MVLSAHGIRYKGELTDKSRRGHLVDSILKDTFGQLVAARKRWPLFLTGDVGSGKTCAALCIIDSWGGWYLTVPGFLERLILAQKGGLTYSTGYARTLDELWRDVQHTNLLVLDELGGREKVSDHHYESVKRLMDVREGKPSVYISNLSLSELGKVYDDRIASRLVFGTTVTLKGDQRLKRDPEKEKTNEQG